VSAKLICPQNHESETADFCSVCGVEMPGAAVPAAPAAKGASCPECGTPRESDRQVFCEVCRYNFQTGAGGIPAARTTTTVPPPLTAPAPPPPVAANAVARWFLEVRVDVNLYGTPNAAAPVNQPPQTFTLFDAETMIGRAGTDVHVQVPIHGDAGVSRRHALLTRRPDGSLALRDLGSANGTQVNGADVMAGVDTPLKDGDTIAVGAWTRITVRAAGA
jgi:FHA domain